MSFKEKQAGRYLQPELIVFLHPVCHRRFLGRMRSLLVTLQLAELMAVRIDTSWVILVIYFDLIKAWH